MEIAKHRFAAGGIEATQAQPAMHATWECMYDSNHFHISDAELCCREKVCATKWYHVARYAMPHEKAEKVEHVQFRPDRPPAPPGCKDAEFSCIGWADSGECESNEAFMIGSPGRPGHCLLSCGRCDLMLHTK